MADSKTNGETVDGKWSDRDLRETENSSPTEGTGQENQSKDGTPNSVNNGTVDSDGHNDKKSSKEKNEEKKIFVGGVGWDTTDDDLKNFFGQFGEVAHVQVKYDHFTGRSRGFAFVEFTSSDACREALKMKDREIKGKKCEVKPAKSRENKKIFIGGLPSDFSEQELRSHFETFGKVDEIEWPFDKFQSKKKNFAFVVFEDEEAAARAATNAKQRFGDRNCDVKIAVPQYMRPQKQANTGGNWGNSGYYGGGGNGGGSGGVSTGGWGDYGNYGGYGYGGYGGGYSYYDDRYGNYDYGGYTAPGAGDYSNWQNYDNWGSYGGSGNPVTPSAGGAGGGHGHRSGGGGNRSASGAGGGGYSGGGYY